MAEIREDFRTKMSVRECSTTFRQAVQKSYSGGRKLIAALGSMRGNSSGGVEFFEPLRQVDASGRFPDWQLGALVPGHSKMYGATKVAVNIYVVDEGKTRFVTLVGSPHMGEKGSTVRLVKSIRSSFRP
jgi:hypothetical protein